MGRCLPILSMLILAVGCADLDNKPYTSDHFYQQRNLIFEQNVEYLSERVKTVLMQDNWRITYQGIEQPLPVTSHYSYITDEKPVGMDASAWHYTMYSTDIPYEFIQARKLTSYGVYAYIIISKQFDQKSSLAITVSAENPDKRQLIKKYNQSFVKQVRDPFVRAEDDSSVIWRTVKQWFN